MIKNTITNTLHHYGVCEGHYPRNHPTDIALDAKPNRHSQMWQESTSKSEPLVYYL